MKFVTIGLMAIGAMFEFSFYESNRSKNDLNLFYAQIFLYSLRQFLLPILGQHLQNLP